ncbi:MAG: hypothetical protein LPK00_03650 [Bacillaceae bacterium]|nr:hypothetical protein [Bacillaceae bacterium]
MKKIIKHLLVVGGIIVALLMNPKDLYYGFKTEKEIKGLAPIFFELVTEEHEFLEDLSTDGSIEVEYLGSNLFQLTTQDITLIIKRERNRSHSDYEIYVKHENVFTRFDGLKKSLF